MVNFAQTRLHCLPHGMRGLDRIAVSQGADGKWVMKTQADYRKLAEDCVSLAQTATEAHRAMLNPMPAVELRRQYCFGKLRHLDPLRAERSIASLSLISAFDGSKFAR